VADDEFGLTLLGEVQVPPEQTEEYAQIQAERLAAEEEDKKKKEQAKLDSEFPTAEKAKTAAETFAELRNMKMSWADMDEEEEEERNRFRDPAKVYYPALKLDAIHFSTEIMKEYNVDPSEEKNTYVVPDIMRAVAKPIERGKFDLRKLCVKKLPADFFDDPDKLNAKMAALYDYFAVHCSYLSGAIEINVLPANSERAGQELPKAFIRYPKDNDDVQFARFLTLGHEFMGSRLNVQFSWFSEGEYRPSKHYINSKIRENMNRPARQRKDTRDSDGFQQQGKHYDDNRGNNRGGHHNNNNRGGYGNNNNRGGYGNNNHSNNNNSYSSNNHSNNNNSDQWRRNDSSPLPSSASTSSVSTSSKPQEWRNDPSSSSVSYSNNNSYSNNSNSSRQQWKPKATTTTTQKPLVTSTNAFAGLDDEDDEDDQ
jgi:hypothetical protein